MLSRFAQLLLIAAHFVHCSGVAAAEVPASSPLQFGAEITQECDKKFGRPESAQVAAWAASFLVKSVVGFAASTLEKATEPAELSKHARAHGYLYRSEDGKTWKRNGVLCLRFWYAPVANSIPITASAEYAVDATLAERWRTMAFSQPAIVYGEILISLDEKTNLSSLDPVVLYARKPPEAGGFWRKVDTMTVAVDLAAIDSDRPFATHLIEVPNVNDRPILLRDRATVGLGSGYFTSPATPVDAAKVSALGGPTFGGPFNVLVTLKSETSATALARAVASTFKDEKQKLTDVLTPTSGAERAQQQQAAVAAAFDAVSAVLEAERALAANEDKTKVDGLKNEAQKAKYLADLKLRAAGLPARYNVSGP